MRIYVASLAAYNAGRLHGTWIDVDDKDEDTIGAEVAAMMAASPEPGEEYAIHDHEGFDGLTVAESTSIADVAAMRDAIEEYGDAFRAAWSERPTLSEALAMCENGYSEYEDAAEYAAECIDDMGGVPAFIRDYIDEERLGSDLLMDSPWATINGRLFVFHG